MIRVFMCVKAHLAVHDLFQDDDYESAAMLAFELGQARQLLAVVNAASARGPESGQRILRRLVAGFGADQIRQCLEFAREWNTNSRHCHAAQAALQAILLQHSPEVPCPFAHVSPSVPVLAKSFSCIANVCQAHGAVNEN
jgi:U3 small nucleolar RNA-associated protein 13